MKKFFFSFLLALISTLAHSANDLLPADEAFSFKASVIGDETRKEILLEWDIAKGYYLYKEKTKISSDFSSQLGEAKFPEAEIIEDEFFGKIGIYRGNIIVAVPILTGDAKSLLLSVTFQGCADLGVCYPPITKSVALDISNIYTKPLSISKLGETAKPSLPSIGLNSESYSEPLPASQAFVFSVIANSKDSLLASWDIKDGYYLYHDKFFIDVDGAQFGEVSFPKGKIKDDEFFGKVEVHRGSLSFEIPLSSISKPEISFFARYQGCWDGGVCYPPQESIVSIAMPMQEAENNEPLVLNIKKEEPLLKSSPSAGVELNETDKIAALLQQDSMLWVLISFFGFGLLLSFTPCVFPMIPILSGIIVGQKEKVSTRKALIMSIVFVLSMSITYAIAGVLAGHFGENLQVLFQTTWILILFSLVFVALAFSMFGYYDIQLPAKMQNKVADMSNRQQGGQLTGVFIMGFLSALIVGPCVAPPLAGALIYIGQTGDALLGGLSLFVMSLGMGAPLLAVGAGVSRLPQAGIWMDNIKYVFGVLMLAVAIYLLDRVLPDIVSLALWATLLTIAPIAMGALNKFDSSSTPWQRIFKSLGLIVLGYGILVWMLVARGGGDMLKPLSHWSSNSTIQSEESYHVKFNQIKSIGELDKVLADSKTSGQIVMLDFYADWCISCKEIEKFVFSSPQVAEALKNIITVQADVTLNDSLDKELMSSLNIIGPPAILFFSGGSEVRARRIIGEIGAQAFLQNLSKI